MEIEITSKMEKTKSKMITMNINSMLPLPPRIIRLVFSKLPILKLPLFRLVCKSWNDLILNHAWNYCNAFFVCPIDIPKMHWIDFDLKYSGRMSLVASVVFEDDWGRIVIISSCNGLLLITKLGVGLNCVGILNPMTNEYIKLPGGGSDSYEDDQTFYYRTENVYLFGFGFSPKTKLYKVARVFYDVKNSSSIFDIFTFGGSNQWRSCVDSVPFMIIRDGVYFNGALYWIVLDNRNDHGLEKENLICRFDVESEKIETTISLLEGRPCREATIQAFNGSVYATFFSMKPHYKIEVWRMQNYGREDSWTREFIINDLPEDWVLPRRRTVFFKLINLYQDGEILCLINGTSSILYNPKCGRITTFNQFHPTSPVYQLHSFNFASLQKILAGDDG